MKQKTKGKKRKANGCTPKIEIMANAMLAPPTHRGKQADRFADMSKNDYHQT